MRLILLFTALAVALGLAVMASQTPAPRPISTPAEAFSAARAMADVREIARAPHPVGSDDHARVQAYLMQRMTAMGLAPQIQTGPLSPRAVQRMEREGRSAQGLTAANLVGVLPGRDPDRPAVLMMAHYDSVPGSPGAAERCGGRCGHSGGGAGDQGAGRGGPRPDRSADRRRGTEPGRGAGPSSPPIRGATGSAPSSIWKRGAAAVGP